MTIFIQGFLKCLSNISTKIVFKQQKKRTEKNWDDSNRQSLLFLFFCNIEKNDTKMMKKTKRNLRASELFL